jgi:group I intron endonuclease
MEQQLLPNLGPAPLVPGPVCFGIAYKITNTVTLAAYIGITRKVAELRFDAHWRASKREDSILYRAFRKYGRCNFVLETIASASSLDGLCQLERDLIIQERTHVRHGGYNMTGGGEGSTDICALTRERMRTAAKIRMTDPEIKDKIRAGNVGRKQSPESTAKTVAARLGKPLSAGHKEKLSIAAKGRIKTAEHCENLSKAMTGRKLSPDHVEAVRAGLVGKRHSDKRRADLSAVRSTPQSRAKTSEANRISWATNPDRRTNQSTKMKLWWARKREC